VSQWFRLYCRIVTHADGRRGVRFQPASICVCLSVYPHGLLIITFVNFAVSGDTSICQLPVPLLPLSFTPNLITAILSTVNSLSFNYPVSSRSRTLLLVLSLNLLSHISSASSPLAHNHWTHRILAPLSYLHSSHNYPTFVPS